jgi:hypothetical protein
MKQKLIQSLAGANKPIKTWISPDGSQVLVLPHGGRMLGLFAPGSEENFFWTHPALESATSASDFYAGNKWHNSGGDRTWFAPEIDFFLPNFPDTSSYWQPREFDPGNYEWVDGKDTIALSNRFSYRLSRSKEIVHLEARKQLAPAANPLSELKSAADVAYAGYTLRTTLAFTEVPSATAKVGIWSLLQLPHGGDFLAPTDSRVEPKILFGSIADSDLLLEENMVRYKMRAHGENKLGLKAKGLTERMGYSRLADGAADLIVRNFIIDPSGDYINAPWSEPEGEGFVIEACNIDSSLGSFSEIEYHAPAIGGLRKQTSYEDVSQLWAFRGKEQEILQIARLLLGGTFGTRDLSKQKG